MGCTIIVINISASAGAEASGEIFVCISKVRVGFSGAFTGHYIAGAIIGVTLTVAFFIHERTAECYVSGIVVIGKSILHAVIRSGSQSFAGNILPAGHPMVERHRDCISHLYIILIKCKMQGKGRCTGFRCKSCVGSLQRSVQGNRICSCPSAEDEYISLIAASIDPLAHLLCLRRTAGKVYLPVYIGRSSRFSVAVSNASAAGPAAAVAQKLIIIYIVKTSGTVAILQLNIVQPCAAVCIRIKINTYMGIGIPCLHIEGNLETNPLASGIVYRNRADSSTVTIRIENVGAKVHAFTRQRPVGAHITGQCIFSGR